MVNTVRTKPGITNFPKQNQSALSEFVIGSASELVSKFLEAEVAEFLATYSDLRDENGKPRMVRNGYLPERKVRTPIGRVPVKIPRVRDRLKDTNGQKIKFNSKLISPYQRRTNVRDNVISRYLLKIKTGDVVEATAAVLGNRMNYATPNTVKRLQEMFEQKSPRSFCGKEFKHIWVDRIPASEISGQVLRPLIVAVGETRDEEKHLLLVLEEQDFNEGIKQNVQKQLGDLNINGDFLILLSESCLSC